MAETTAGDILSPHTHQIRDLTQRLRKLVNQAVPRTTEKVYPGWHGFCFHDPKAGYFCGIFPQTDSVKLGFEFGRVLLAPQGLRQGEGKQVRYVVLEPGERLPVESISDLIPASLAINDR